MTHPLAGIDDTELARIGTLLHSNDEAVHRQGLELLEALAPAGPAARRGKRMSQLGASPQAYRDLCGARFLYEYIRGSRQPQDFRHAILVGALYHSMMLERADVSGADLRYSRLYTYPDSLRMRHVPFKTLAGADLRGAVLPRLILRGVDMHSEAWAGVRLAGADLSEAVLCGGRFSHIDLTGVNLTGADLRGVNLKGTILRGADLTGAKLFRTNLKGADLTGAIMRFDDTIRWDAATRWPTGQAPAPGQRPSRLSPRYGR